MPHSSSTPRRSHRFRRSSAVVSEAFNAPAECSLSFLQDLTTLLKTLSLTNVRGRFGSESFDLLVAHLTRVDDGDDVGCKASD